MSDVLKCEGSKDEDLVSSFDLMNLVKDQFKGVDFGNPTGVIINHRYLITKHEHLCSRYVHKNLIIGKVGKLENEYIEYEFGVREGSLKKYITEGIAPLVRSMLSEKGIVFDKYLRIDVNDIVTDCSNTIYSVKALGLEHVFTQFHTFVKSSIKEFNSKFGDLVSITVIKYDDEYNCTSSYIMTENDLPEFTNVLKELQAQ